VTLLDRKLGILYMSCILLVFGYVIGVRVILQNGYMGMEKSYGVIGAKVNGTTYFRKGATTVGSTTGAVVPFDVAALVRFQEGDALFLPTRILTTAEQTLGNCTDPEEPCATADDCADDPPLAIGECVSGYCMKHMWCSAGGTGAQADPFTTTSATVSADQIMLQNLSSLKIVIVSEITFSTLGTGAILNTADGRTSADGSKAKFRWDLGQVLQRAAIETSTAVTDGAVIGVSLQWDCENLATEAECLPHLVAKVLSGTAPYFAEWADYYRRGTTTAEQAIQYRDLHQARGLRLLFMAEGTGEKIDPVEIGTLVFIMLALFPIASVLADTIMQNLFSERRHYREYKVEISPDFSDVRAKVEQLEKQSQSRQSKMMNYAA